MNLIELRPEGLYCPPGGFYIDPWRGVERAVITHAHGDHARYGSQHYFSTLSGEALIKSRLGKVDVTSYDYGEVFQMGETRVSFHSAGHILGSAQVRIEYEGDVWVFTGDFKRTPDPSCEPFEVVECDTLITEATFALPIYHWSDPDEVAQQIVDWWLSEGNHTRVLLCYSLGKAQRVLAELARLAPDTDRPVYLHGAATRLVQIYRDQGWNLWPTRAVSEMPKDFGFKGDLVLAPPSAAGNNWMRRFHKPEQAFASGWMAVRGIKRRRNYSRGFVMSDHADWDELLQTVVESGCSRVLCTHGRSDLFVRYLREHIGLDAAELKTAFVEDGGE